MDDPAQQIKPQNDSVRLQQQDKISKQGYTTVKYLVKTSLSTVLFELFCWYPISPI